MEKKQGSDASGFQEVSNILHPIASHTLQIECISADVLAFKDVADLWAIPVTLFSCRTARFITDTLSCRLKVTAIAFSAGSPAPILRKHSTSVVASNRSIFEKLASCACTRTT